MSEMKIEMKSRRGEKKGKRQSLSVLLHCARGIFRFYFGWVYASRGPKRGGFVHQEVIGWEQFFQLRKCQREQTLQLGFTMTFEGNSRPMETWNCNLTLVAMNLSFNLASIRRVAWSSNEVELLFSANTINLLEVVVSWLCNFSGQQKLNLPRGERLHVRYDRSKMELTWSITPLEIVSRLSADDKVCWRSMKPSRKSLNRKIWALLSPHPRFS